MRNKQHTVHINQSATYTCIREKQALISRKRMLGEKMKSSGNGLPLPQSGICKRVFNIIVLNYLSIFMCGACVYVQKLLQISRMLVKQRLRVLSDIVDLVQVYIPVYLCDKCRIRDCYNVGTFYFLNIVSTLWSCSCLVLLCVPFFFFINNISIIFAFILCRRLLCL